MNMTVAKIDQQLQAILRSVNSNNQQPSHHISSSSAISTMIPTPGILHSGSSLNSIMSVDNSMRNTSGAGMVVQPANTGSLLPTANGSVGGGNIASFNASNGNCNCLLFCLHLSCFLLIIG